MYRTMSADNNDGHSFRLLCGSEIQEGQGYGV